MSLLVDQEAIRSSAVISECGLYRYELTRHWEGGMPVLVTCMLNPSTADADRDDPTIRTLIHFAHAWGYGGLMVVNLFGLRTSDPRVLHSTHDPRGPKNTQFVDMALTLARHQGKPMLAAWGDIAARHTAPKDQEDGPAWLIDRARKHTVDLVCLGTTKDGYPKHPMARGKHRIPRDQTPVMFRRAMEAN